MTLDGRERSGSEERVWSCPEFRGAWGKLPATAAMHNSAHPSSASKLAAAPATRPRLARGGLALLRLFRVRGVSAGVKA